MSTLVGSKPKVAVVGGGWYGCHIALTLRERGFDVTLFEKEQRLFQGASGNNQFRLHAGFHYPRSYLTREQIQNGLKEFNSRLPQFVRKLDTCVYAISSVASLLDFGTFLNIFKSENIPYETLYAHSYGISNVEGAIHAPTEEVFYVNTPREYYEVSLKRHSLIKTDVLIEKLERSRCLQLLCDEYTNYQRRKR